MDSLALARVWTIGLGLLSNRSWQAQENSYGFLAVNDDAVTIDLVLRTT